MIPPLGSLPFSSPQGMLQSSGSPYGMQTWLPQLQQGWDDPYVTRTHEGLLKWKYPEMNYVDFIFEVAENHQSLFLNERGKKKLMEHLMAKIEAAILQLKQNSNNIDEAGDSW